MRCNTQVQYHILGKKKPKKKPRRFVTTFHREVNGIPVTDDMELCDGNIVASILAVNEPDWGGTYAELEIKYVCDKCGCNYFGELPQTVEELNEFFNDIICNLTEEQRQLLLAKRKQEKADNDARGVEAMKRIN
jgi:hypothetical protein